jgi:hypothetical protein
MKQNVSWKSVFIPAGRKQRAFLKKPRVCFILIFYGKYCFFISLSKKSPGWLRVAALNPFFRLCRFIRQKGLPGTGGFFMLFVARASEGREARSGYTGVPAV